MSIGGSFRLALLGLLLSAASGLPGLRAEEPGRRPIMAGDRLRISIVESPELSRVYSVAGDGTIDFGFLGRTQIDGLTLDAAAQRLSKSLEESYFKRATVSVEVEDYVEGSILMIGALESPGSMDFRGDQILTLVEAITARGGLTPDADGQNVRILRSRPGGGLERQVITVNVKAMIESLDFTQDQYLRPRDMIIVPKLGAAGQTAEFLALGEFGQAGFHPHQEGLDIIRAVVQAGGLSREARMDAVRLLRPDGSGGAFRAIPIDLSRLFGSADMQMNIPVLPGDILFAPSISQASGGQIYLLGEVNTPGIVPLPLQGEATLARTLLVSGGMTKFANAARVRIQRSAPDGKRMSIEVDVGRILKTGSFDEDVPLRDGDVIIVPERMLF